MFEWRERMRRLLSRRDIMPMIRLIALALIVVSCGPDGATPMPEPPALAHVKVERVAPVLEDVPPPTWPAGVKFDGRANTAPPGSLVYVTNLDSTEPPAVAQAAADGSFSIQISVSPGDELRFQAVSDVRRSAPRDLQFTVDAVTQVAVSAQVERPSCITLTPEYALSFASGVSTQHLLLTNTCPTAATLQNPRFRTQPESFELRTKLPLTLPASGSLELEVTRSAEQVPNSEGEVEQILFFDLALDASSIRYPITLFAR